MTKVEFKVPMVQCVWDEFTRTYAMGMLGDPDAVPRFVREAVEAVQQDTDTAREAGAPDAVIAEHIRLAQVMQEYAIPPSEHGFVDPSIQAVWWLFTLTYQQLAAKEPEALKAFKSKSLVLALTEHAQVLATASSDEAVADRRKLMQAIVEYEGEQG